MDDQYENGLEICNHDGVLLKKASASHISEINTFGCLSLVHLPNKVYFIEWRPNDGFMISDTDTQEQDEWSFVDTIVRRNRTTSESLIFNSATNNICVKDSQTNAPIINNPLIGGPRSRNIRVKITDLKSVELLKNGQVIRLFGHDGKIHSEYSFQYANAYNFIRALLTTNCLQCSSRNRNLFEVTEEHVYDHDKLQKTFAELKIEDIKSGSGSWISNMVRRPYEQTMDMFAKIADVYAIVPGAQQKNYQQYDNPSDKSPPVGFERQSATVSPTTVPHTMLQSTTEDYEMLSTSPKTSSTNGESTASGGSVEASSTDSTEMVEKGPMADIKVVPREKPLDELEWRAAISEDGSISIENVNKIKQRIYRGGIENSIRAEVWKYLLDYDLWEQDTKEKELARSKKKTEYYTMKSQWLRMSAIQEKNFSDFRDRKCQIEKDVKRTDRTHEFFAGDNNPNLEKLHEILMTYVMYNFDLGYVQGMSDLLAPILYVMQDEKDAFWCFVGFMDKVFTNFDIDQAGMKRQLQDLNKLIAFTNPRLHNYFKETGSDNMYFCFRWLLVWFKREFSQDDIMTLWEGLWTGLPCINFHLFISVAILDDQKDIFIENNYEFTEILKHVNELSMNINLKSTLEKAEAIYEQVKNSTHLTDEIRMIIGEEPLEKNDSRTDSDDESETITSLAISQEEEEKRQRKIEEALEQSMYYNFF